VVELSLKEEFLALLESDVEFRYAVAGKLDLLELLRRLDSIEAELKALREDFNSMLAEIRSMNVRLSRVERTLEKLTLGIEEEARLVVK